MTKCVCYNNFPQVQEFHRFHHIKRSSTLFYGSVPFFSSVQSEQESIEKLLEEFLQLNQTEHLVFIIQENPRRKLSNNEQISQIGFYPLSSYKNLWINIEITKCLWTRMYQTRTPETNWMLQKYHQLSQAMGYHYNYRNICHNIYNNFPNHSYYLIQIM